MKNRQRVELNLTPLIDIIFILFTFFLVATVFKKEETALNIKLPKTKYFDTSKENDKILKIFIKGNIVGINNETFTLKKFANILRHKRHSTVELRIDRKTTFETISLVLDVLKENNFNDIIFVTDKK